MFIIGFFIGFIFSLTAIGVGILLSKSKVFNTTIQKVKGFAQGRGEIYMPETKEEEVINDLKGKINDLKGKNKAL